MSRDYLLGTFQLMRVQNPKLNAIIFSKKYTKICLIILLFIMKTFINKLLIFLPF